MPLRRLAPYLLAACFLSLNAQPPATSQPETVLVTFHPKPGAEAELQRAIADHWRTALQLKLVLPEPHLTLRGADPGGIYFVEIFSWRDASAPDNAPAPIRQIWDRMNALVESRPGRPGLDFTPVELLAAPLAR